MPLQEKCSKEAYQANIAQLLDEGYEMEQAVAIASSVLERACDAEGKPVPKCDNRKR